MKSIDYKEKAREIRNKVLDICVEAKAGHVASSFSCIELLVGLYYNILKYDPLLPEWKERDRFVLSKGHASPALYAILADTGFFPEEWLWEMCKKDGYIGIHTQKNVLGIEASTGSLGHGFGIAIGMALAAKMNNEEYFTFVLLSDGECYEGAIWEGAMFAGHHNINNIVAIVDRNWQCATDFTEDCIRLEPLDDKWRAFGWDVKRIDGHSFEDIFVALKDVRSKRGKPLVIIADTVKGKGVDFIEHQVLWHTRIPKGEQVETARQQLKEVLE